MIQQTTAAPAAPAVPTQPPAAPQPPAAAAPPAGPDPMAPQDKMTVITVGVEVPESLLIPDPKTGEAPIKDYEVKVLHKNFILTTREEINAYTQQIKDELVPLGTEIKPAMSPTGQKILLAKMGLSGVAQLGGALATQSVIWPGTFMAIPLGVAAPLALVGGALGAVSSLDQWKEAADQKALFESMKARGVEKVPVPVQVMGPNGPMSEIQLQPIDDVIAKFKDTQIAAGGQLVSSGLMIAAGATLNPALAVASLGTQLVVGLYTQRQMLSLAGKKALEAVKTNSTVQGGLLGAAGGVALTAALVGSAFGPLGLVIGGVAGAVVGGLVTKLWKKMFGKAGEEGAANPANPPVPGAPPPPSPTAPPTPGAPTPAPAPAPAPAPGDQQMIMPTPGQARAMMAEIQAPLQAKIDQLRGMQAQIQADPKLLERPDIKALTEEVGQGMALWAQLQAIANGQVQQAGAPTPAPAPAPAPAPPPAQPPAA